MKRHFEVINDSFNVDQIQKSLVRTHDQVTQLSAPESTGPLELGEALEYFVWQRDLRCFLEMHMSNAFARTWVRNGYGMDMTTSASTSQVLDEAYLRDPRVSAIMKEVYAGFGRRLAFAIGWIADAAFRCFFNAICTFYAIENAALPEAMLRGALQSGAAVSGFIDALGLSFGTDTGRFMRLFIELDRIPALKNWLTRQIKPNAPDAWVLMLLKSDAIKPIAFTSDEQMISLFKVMKDLRVSGATMMRCLQFLQATNADAFTRSNGLPRLPTAQELAPLMEKFARTRLGTKNCGKLLDWLTLDTVECDARWLQTFFDWAVASFSVGLLVEQLTPGTPLPTVHVPLQPLFEWSDFVPFTVRFPEWQATLECLGPKDVAQRLLSVDATITILDFSPSEWHRVFNAPYWLALDGALRFHVYLRLFAAIRFDVGGTITRTIVEQFREQLLFAPRPSDALLAESVSWPCLLRMYRAGPCSLDLLRLVLGSEQLLRQLVLDHLPTLVDIVSLCHDPTAADEAFTVPFLLDVAKLMRGSVRWEKSLKLLHMTFPAASTQELLATISPTK